MFEPQVVEKAVATFGKVDVLVNNAGVSTDQKLEQFDVEQWNKVMSINLTGCMLGMKYAVPEMKKAGGGSVIHISSIAGLVALNYTNAYTAAKGALRSLAKASAVELAPDNIRVNSVHPGIIVTPMIQETLDHGAGQMFERGTPLPRLGKPEDIAYGVLYLASDESSFVTGTELVIDGGWTAR
ncbi:SDR family oxidoreductase [Brevibacillus sp. FSL K6-0770]|uniref:SDR family oxidoreductase n=1 Tax=unclassified Brevibacillus TaxID=2684853 RepID=UPI00247395AA|nr:SDR family oxidoreductase [Brevibacillus sp. 1238]MDH6351769.1 NAD(P)-dependent dehydrogenase (short-subunit alcohol dehydrogenase family) [Brevibacillus sp. 1238]